MTELDKSTISIYKHDNLKVMLVTNEHTLSDCLRAFENVLKGSGFCFDGELDIVEEENG